MTGTYFVETKDQHSFRLDDNIFDDDKAAIERFEWLVRKFDRLPDKSMAPTRLMKIVAVEIARCEKDEDGNLKVVPSETIR